MLPVDPAAARRFILGKQGLWPARRWRGIVGVREALATIEHLQLDPLNVAGRAHDLILQARVAGYRPEMLETAAYGERRAFDWGDWLALRPMSELPFFRVIMRRRAQRPTYVEIAAEHRAAIKWVRAEIERRGPLRPRDLVGTKRVESYRGRKDTSLALFYLWIKGELMTSSRPRFERMYDLAERVAPAAALAAAEPTAADRFHALKMVAFQGIGRIDMLKYNIDRPLGGAELAAMKKRLVKAGDLVPVQVAGWRGEHFARGADLPLLEEVMRGDLPQSWRPVDKLDRVTFLSPLDIVSARGRAKQLFDFDYVWEVYKKVELRRWGYYVLPVLWGDRLVARIDVRKDGANDRLEVLGFWLEEGAPVKAAAFVAAFQEGLRDFLGFLGVSGLKATGPGARALRALAGV